MMNRVGVALKTINPVISRIAIPAKRCFSVVKNPDEYFDNEMENDKEFLDIASSIYKGGIENITTVNAPLTWERLEEARDEPLHFELPKTVAEEPEEVEDESLSERNLINQRNKQDFLLNVLSNQDLGDHIGRFRNGVVPIERLNYTVPWNKKGTFYDRPLSKFLSQKSPERFTDLNQGMRACPGKLQRHGVSGELRCHKIDLDALNHMDVMTLRKYLSADAEIMSRRKTGLCAKCQRQVATTIKRARHMSILPHIGDYEIQEVRPALKREEFHDAVNSEHSYVPNTTVVK